MRFENAVKHLVKAQFYILNRAVFFLKKKKKKNHLCNDPSPMTQYSPLLDLQTRLPRRSPILGLLSQKHA